MPTTVSYSVAQVSSRLYQIETKVSDALRKPRTRFHAHLKLCPSPRPGWTPGQIPADANPAAVLVLLYLTQDAPHFILTVRTHRLNRHAGQISLPGGMVEKDETIRNAALRETYEELGIDQTRIRLQGDLSALYIPVTNIALYPVVGFSDRPLKFLPSKDEVDRVVQVPLTELANQNNFRHGIRWRKGQCYRVPYFALQEERVWGATAMVLSELLDVLGMSQKDSC